MAQTSGAPVLSYDDLRRAAGRFLKRFHPSLAIPVPIEEIIDLHFKIDIVPMPGLHRDIEIDAFVTSDVSTIYVDEFVYESRPARYRFSLAHELARVTLHHQVFGKLRFSTIEQWKRTMARISRETYAWLEWQAYALAGLILVPAQPLARFFKATVTAAAREGVSVKPASEAARHIIAGTLAKRFEVSAECVRRRLEKDKLWEGE